jgi:hypothetical protein
VFLDSLNSQDAAIKLLAEARAGAEAMREMADQIKSAAWQEQQHAAELAATKAAVEGMRAEAARLALDASAATAREAVAVQAANDEAAQVVAGALAAASSRELVAIQAAKYEAVRLVAEAHADADLAREHSHDLAVAHAQEQAARLGYMGAAKLASHAKAGADTARREAERALTIAAAEAEVAKLQAARLRAELKASALAGKWRNMANERTKVERAAVVADVKAKEAEAARLHAERQMHVATQARKRAEDRKVSSNKTTTQQAGVRSPIRKPAIAIGRPWTALPTDVSASSLAPPPLWDEASAPDLGPHEQTRRRRRRRRMAAPQVRPPFAPVRSGSMLPPPPAAIAAAKAYERRRRGDIAHLASRSHRAPLHAPKGVESAASSQAGMTASGLQPRAGSPMEQSARRSRSATPGASNSDGLSHFDGGLSPVPNETQMWIPNSSSPNSQPARRPVSAPAPAPLFTPRRAIKSKRLASLATPRVKERHPLIGVPGVRAVRIHGPSTVQKGAGWGAAGLGLSLGIPAVAVAAALPKSEGIDGGLPLAPAVVVHVTAGGPADEAGVRHGEVLLAVDGQLLLPEPGRSLHMASLVSTRSAA